MRRDISITEGAALLATSPASFVNSAPVGATASATVVLPDVIDPHDAGDTRNAVRGPTRARRWWPYFAVAGLFWALPAVLLLVGYLVLPDYITGSQCEGGGFGCAFTPKDGTVVLAIYGYPLLVVAGWLIMAVIAIGRAFRHRLRWLIGKSPRGVASLATRRPVDAA